MKLPFRCLIAAICVVLGTLAGPGLVRAQDAPQQAAEAAADAPRFDTQKRGLFTTALPERSDDSKPSALSRAFGSAALRGFDDYDIADQTFTVFVPKEYRHDRAHGLVIWLGDDGDGGLPRDDWDSTLNRFKLIFIAPHDAGKDAPPARRMALALDALHNAKQHYTIDPGRVYIAGYGDAAQLAAALLGAMADQFSGAIYVNGSAPPPGRGRTAQHLRENARIGFLIGEKSKAREQADQVYEEHYKGQFKHLERQVSRVGGENMPTNRYFESTFFALEKPLAESAQRLLASAAQLQRGRKYDEAWLQFATAAARSPDEEVAQAADKGIAALRQELDAELAKVVEARESGNEPVARAAAVRLERDWGRWGRIALDWLDRGEAPPEGDTQAATNGDSAPAATGTQRPASAVNNTADAAQPPARSPREEAALRRLESARQQLGSEPADAYEAFESIVKRYPGTPAARAAAVEIAQIDADPEKGPAIAAALAERRARALLSLAMNYRNAGAKPQAVEALRELIEKYPKSDQAVEAKLILMELGEQP